MTAPTTPGEIRELIATSSASELQDLLGMLSPAQVQEVLDGLDPADFPALLEKIGPPVLAALAQGISTPSELRRFLELAGGDDEVVNRFIARAGVDGMLDRVFDLMGTHFLPEKVGPEGGTVEWHVATPEGAKVYHLTIRDGRAAGTRGPAERPRTTLTMSAPDLLRLCAGTIDGVTAFMHSKIKLAGDMMFGAKLPSAFDTSA